MSLLSSTVHMELVHGPRDCDSSISPARNMACIDRPLLATGEQWCMSGNWIGNICSLCLSIGVICMLMYSPSRGKKTENANTFAAGMERTSRPWETVCSIVEKQIRVPFYCFLFYIKPWRERRGEMAHFKKNWGGRVKFFPESIRG